MFCTAQPSLLLRQYNNKKILPKKINIHINMSDKLFNLKGGQALSLGNRAAFVLQLSSRCPPKLRLEDKWRTLLEDMEDIPEDIYGGHDLMQIIKLIHINQLLLLCRWKHTEESFSLEKYFLIYKHILTHFLGTQLFF